MIQRKILTRKSLAADALARWRYQYPADRWKGHVLASGKDPRTIERKLEELGPDPDPEAVVALTSPRYCTVTCGECKRDVQATIRVGLQDDDRYPEEGDSLDLCMSCLDEIAEQLRSSLGSQP